jgi:hypothetical protein
MDLALPGLMGLERASSLPTSAFLLLDGPTQPLLARCGAAIDAGLRSSLAPVVPCRICDIRQSAPRNATKSASSWAVKVTLKRVS